jgi:hypothetical protein
MGKKRKYDKTYGFACSEEHKIKIAQKGLKPENFRQFIEKFGTDENGKNTIKSSEWKRLRDIMEKTPSLNVVGDINSGKTFLAKQLISQDKNHIYIVLDAHNEYDTLPIINTINTDIKESCRIKLPDQPAGAVGMFSVYYNLIMNNQFPKQFVLIVDEALRYKEAGIKNLIAESRKFLKIMAISQEQIVDFCPTINVENYNKIRI